MMEDGEVIKARGLLVRAQQETEKLYVTDRPAQAGIEFKAG